MSKIPLVSIIMSVYNDEAYVEYAINSVLKQTFSSWEFIIIDDFSTDNSKSKIREYQKKEKRIKFISNNMQQGLIKNLNTGIKLSKGEYIARIDSDDTWFDKTKLARQVNFLKNNSDYGLVGTWANVINEKGAALKKIQYPFADPAIRDYILVENCFIHSSILLRKTVLQEVGVYDLNYEHAEDYNLWLRVGLISKFCNIPKYMINYRLNPEGVTKTKYHVQVRNAIKSVNTFKSYYPNYLKGILLWNLREYFPQDLKDKIAKSFKQENI